MPERTQLHVSGLNKLSFCGVQFEYIYLRNLRRPPSAYLLAGSGTDRAVEYDLGFKIKAGILAPEANVTDVAADTVKEEWRKEPPKLDADEKALGKRRVRAETIDKAVRLSTLHHRWVAPGIVPKKLQRKFSLRADEFLRSRGIEAELDLVGTMDVQESHSIRDVKTSGKTPNQAIADMSEQLTMYALGMKIEDGRGPREVMLDYLIDLKTPKALTLRSRRTEKDFEILLNRVEAAVRVIRSGAFIPASADDPMCSEKYCGFHAICPYARRPKSVAVRKPQLVQIAKETTDGEGKTDGANQTA